jgi:hypothetical protein
MMSVARNGVKVVEIAKEDTIIQKKVNMLALERRIRVSCQDFVSTQSKFARVPKFDGGDFNEFSDELAERLSPAMRGLGQHCTICSSQRNEQRISDQVGLRALSH